MRRPLTVVGALSNVGASPYDDGVARDLNRAPAVLRERGLVSRLRGIDMGDVIAPSYRDYTRLPDRVRNQEQVATYSRALAQRLSCAMAHDSFGLVVGGDCSVVLGCLLAGRSRAGDQLGLIYVDAHADYAVNEESVSGAAANMALAMATGRDRSPLATLAGATRLVDGVHTALIGRRHSSTEGWAATALAESSILDVSSAQLLSDDRLELAALTLDRVAGTQDSGFWIQLDVDVLNPMVMGAVEAPEAGGPTAAQLIEFLRPIVRHPQALGMSVTTYDPALDPDRSCARQLVAILEALFAPSVSG